MLFRSYCWFSPGLVGGVRSYIPGEGGSSIPEDMGVIGGEIIIGPDGVCPGNCCILCGLNCCWIGWGGWNCRLWEAEPLKPSTGSPISLSKDRISPREVPTKALVMVLWGLGWVAVWVLDILRVGRWHHVPRLLRMLGWHIPAGMDLPLHRLPRTGTFPSAEFVVLVNRFLPTLLQRRNERPRSRTETKDLLVLYT